MARTQSPIKTGRDAYIAPVYEEEVSCGMSHMLAHRFSLSEGLWASEHTSGFYSQFTATVNASLKTHLHCTIQNANSRYQSQRNSNFTAKTTNVHIILLTLSNTVPFDNISYLY